MSTLVLEQNYWKQGDSVHKYHTLLKCLYIEFLSQLKSNSILKTLWFIFEFIEAFKIAQVSLLLLILKGFE